MKAENNLTWIDVGGLSDYCFDVWVHNRELEWAEKIWSIFIEMGLANFNSAAEKLNAIKNIICLSFIYKDFCCRYIDEGISYEDEDWVAVVVSYYPELRGVISMYTPKEFFKSVNELSRRALLAKTIMNKYQRMYKSDFSSSNYILDDLIATVRFDGGLEFEDLELPFDELEMKYDEPELFQFLQDTKLGDLLGWIQDGMYNF